VTRSFLPDGDRVESPAEIEGFLARHPREVSVARHGELLLGLHYGRPRMQLHPAARVEPLPYGVFLLLIFPHPISSDLVLQSRPGVTPARLPASVPYRAPGRRPLADLRSSFRHRAPDYDNFERLLPAEWVDLLLGMAARYAVVVLNDDGLEVGPLPKSCDRVAADVLAVARLLPMLEPSVRRGRQCPACGGPLAAGVNQRHCPACGLSLG